MWQRSSMNDNTEEIFPEKNSILLVKTWFGFPKTTWGKQHLVAKIPRTKSPCWMATRQTFINHLRRKLLKQYADKLASDQTRVHELQTRSQSPQVRNKQLTQGHLRQTLHDRTGRLRKKGK